MKRIAIFIGLAIVFFACGNDKTLSEKAITIQIQKANSESNDSRSLNTIPTKKKNRINSCISR